MVACLSTIHDSGYLPSVILIIYPHCLPCDVCFVEVLAISRMGEQYTLCFSQRDNWITTFEFLSTSMNQIESIESELPDH